MLSTLPQVGFQAAPSGQRRFGDLAPLAGGGCGGRPEVGGAATWPGATGRDQGSARCLPQPCRESRGKAGAWGMGRLGRRSQPGGQEGVSGHPQRRPVAGVLSPRQPGALASCGPQAEKDPWSMASQAELSPMGKRTAWGGLGQWGQWDPFPSSASLRLSWTRAAAARCGLWLSPGHRRPEHARVRQLPPHRSACPGHRRRPGQGGLVSRSQLLISLCSA